ncbi:HSPB1-associated protein 1-like [Patiria miniata]|uniref:JmjC domain-containing protein n=1 Tax=Patiria miniata TaxID=46514 RepID=A0A914BPZ6_PATMI|nr:HSPB1-associated protein 1-like [Patiria miniata]
MAMQHARLIYEHLNGAFSQPLVLKNSLDSWPSRQWSPDYLASVLKEKKVKIRTGSLSAQNLNSVLWEVDCTHEEATLGQFCEWLRSDAPTTCSAQTSQNPLLKYKRQDHWCYVDYKQMAFMFEDHPDILQAVRWSDLGFEDRDGRQSTLWIGSAGAFTPGHYDTYGFNLVAQIYGRKRWHLFPPSQTHLLYPTRIPYEESSVFSPVNIANPALDRYPKFVEATPYVVTLEPGEVLFVPKHWWHFVESLETSISINTWVDVESDKESRIQEAVTRVLISSLMSTSCDSMKWVNPSETICTGEVNYRYVEAAVQENSHKSPWPCGIKEASDLSELQCQNQDTGQPGDLPTHRLDSTVQSEEVARKLEMKDVEKSVALDEALKTDTPESDLCNPAETSDNSNLCGDSRDKLRDSSADDGGKIGGSSRKGSKLKRRLCDFSDCEAQSKLQKTNPNPPSPAHWKDALPDFIVPVICQGQIYKRNQQVKSNPSDKKSADEIVNMQMRSEVKPKDSIDKMRRMIAECVTHPAVISLTSALLQEKFDQQKN